MFRITERLLWGKRPHDLGSSLKALSLEILHGKRTIDFDHVNGYVRLERVGTRRFNALRLSMITPDTVGCIEEDVPAPFYIPVLIVTKSGHVFRVTEFAEGVFSDGSFSFTTERANQSSRQILRLMRKGQVNADKQEVLACIKLLTDMALSAYEESPQD